MTREQAKELGHEYYVNDEGGCCKVDLGCTSCIYKDNCGEYEAWLQDELDMLEKINNHTMLTDIDLQYLVQFYAIETIFIGIHKKKLHYVTIIKLSNQYFTILWQKGCTKEIFHNQPEEVYAKTESIFTDSTKWLSSKYDKFEDD